AWVRGTDNAGDERGPGLPTTVRPSIHGDVLHSRPVVIDYGEPIGPVVFYGSNDGLLRAVGAARDGPFAGQELWGFVAPEFFGRLARLRENWPLVAYPTMPEGLAAQPRDYFFDGPVGVYRNSATGSTILYPTMRRGGRTIYAIDVSDPLQPRFLWKKTPQDLPVLGQTWSEPRVARIRGQSGPVLVLGAGYDASAEDADPRGATSAGNAVLVLDALTGQLLRQFSGTARSVAADVALLDSDNDGYVDRAYAVDLGANIYRIDFESATGAALSPTGWTMYRLAALDDGIGSRKFFFTPDLVVTRQFVALLLGSGDREKPLKAFSNDRFFLVKDTHLGKGPPSPTWSAIRADDLAAVGTEGPFDHGCQLRLSGTGEKVVTAATSIAGKTYFSTNRPTPATPGSCSANLGEARNYEFPLFCKPASSHTLIGGGLPPSPVAGLVRVPYASPHDGSPAARVVPFIVGGPNPKRSALEITRVNPVIPVRRSRAYWYLESDDR
ncbi:MAG TPA: PilC/PilY family type IV pilus protein, partial [Burkholderiaceae bacterium]|nr:PilC/PilY family type IV pilus protein [Burkholderiaceae bacterium]